MDFMYVLNLNIIFLDVPTNALWYFVGTAAFVYCLLDRAAYDSG